MFFAFDTKDLKCIEKLLGSDVKVIGVVMGTNLQAQYDRLEDNVSFKSKNVEQKPLITIKSKALLNFINLLGNLIKG